MLKSKLLKNSNKDKDTNSNNVNNKDSGVHNKNGLKKLLNGKTSGHNILNIKPVKPKGSLYDLNNGIEEKVKVDDTNDNMTLTSSSPTTLETVNVKDKNTLKKTDNSNLNNLNDTQSSPNLHWASSVTSGSGKGLANTTFDSMKTLSSSNINSPKTTPVSTTNLTVNTNHQNTESKPSSPYLAPPKSPLELFTRISPINNSENYPNNYKSVPNLSDKNSNNSLQEPDSLAHSVESGMNKISKKLSKKEKKEAYINATGGKKSSSLFSSIGKYFKNKTTDKIKEGKKLKDKADINDLENLEEQMSRDVESIRIAEKDDVEASRIDVDTIKIKTDNINTANNTIQNLDSDVLKTPIPKKEKDIEINGEKRQTSVEFTPKPQKMSIPSNTLNKKPHQSPLETISTSMQSETLVENQPTKSEPSSISSAASQPVPINNDNQSLKVLDQSMKITSSPSSLPPLSSSLLSSSESQAFVDGTAEDITANTREKDNSISVDKEGTYRQSSSKYDDTSFLDNEDTIIKKNSTISTNNNRLSVRDINFCRELRLAGDLEGTKNSLCIESTITEIKRQSTSSLSENIRSSYKALAEGDEPKTLPTELPKSPLSTAIPVSSDEKPEETRSLFDNKFDTSKTNSKDNISKKSSFLEVKDDSQMSFDSVSMSAASFHDFSHNILASSPQLSIPSPYSRSNFSTTDALKNNKNQERHFNAYIPKAPSAIGLVTTPSNSTQATSISEHPKVSASLDAIHMSYMEEPMEEKRCPYCHCIILNNTNLNRPNFDPSLHNISFDDDRNSILSSSRFSSATKITMSPKLTSMEAPSKTNPSVHHYNQFLSSGGPGSIASSVSSKDYSRSINSSFTFSTVTSTTSEEDCDCYCHEAYYQHPEFPVYHSKHGANSEKTSQASVSGMSFNSYQSRYSNYSYYADSVNKIYDKRSYCSTTSSLSVTKSLFFNPNDKNKNMRRKDFSKSSREIGRGATCVVKLVHKVNDPSLYFALKEYKLSRVKQNIDERTFLKRLRNEYQIGSLLHHPNIIETYAFLMTKTHNHKRKKYFVVLEYCDGGDLFSAIQKGDLGRKEINCNFKQLMDGVNYLHSLGVAHCDIKPENILIKDVSHIKIIDFGTSEIFKYPYTPDVIKKSKGVKGSKPYIAPEQFQRSEYDPRASDIWSCAIVYIASLFDELPWRVASLEDFDFLRWKKERRNDLIRHIPDGPRQLITQMLNPDPEKRITMDQIYENEWFKSIKTCISGEVQCHDKKHYHIKPQDSSS